MSVYPYITLYGNNESHKLSLIEPYTFDDKLIVGFDCQLDQYSRTYFFNIKTNDRTGFRYGVTYYELNRQYRYEIDKFTEYAQMSNLRGTRCYDNHYFDEARQINEDCPNYAVKREFRYILERSRRQCSLNEFLRDIDYFCERLNTFEISYSGRTFMDRVRGNFVEQDRNCAGINDIPEENFIPVCAVHDVTSDGTNYILKKGFIEDSIVIYKIKDGTLAERIYQRSNGINETHYEIADGFIHFFVADRTDDDNKFMISYKRRVRQDEIRTVTIIPEGYPMYYPQRRNSQPLVGLDFSNTTNDFSNTTNVIHAYNYVPRQGYQKHVLSEEDISTTLLLGAELEFEEGGRSEEHAKKVLEIMNGDAESEKNIFAVGDGSLENGIEFPTQPCSLAYHKTLPYKEMFEYLDSHGYKGHDSKNAGLHIHINRSFFGNKEEECIGKLMYIVEKFNDEFTIIGRRGCKYADFVGYNGEKCKDIYLKYGKIGKELCDYRSAKYTAINTQHKDTIEIRCFKSTLKYSTFMLTLEFVQDLAKYVKKHSEEEVENMNWEDLMDTFSDELREYYEERKIIVEKKRKEEEKERVSNIAATAEVPDNIRYTVEPFIIVARSHNGREYNCIFDESSLSNYFDTLATSNANYYTDMADDKKVKSLKKNIKNEKNPMRKKQLQKELQDLQKEINKKKRSERTRVSNS